MNRGEKKKHKRLRRAIQRQCRSKRGYKTVAEAQVAVENTPRMGYYKRVLHVYDCNFCDWYHVGHHWPKAEDDADIEVESRLAGEGPWSDCSAIIGTALRFRDGPSLARLAA